jgi:ubiquitin C-terminal hydrolase
VNHQGEHIEGHYSVYCRKPNDVWLCIDDDKVYTVAKKRVITNMAYLLIYKEKE